MATKQLVTKVWIDPGCIVCDACETTAPDVFHVTDDTCIIRPDALTPEFTKPRSQNIVDAAEECPVDVIKFETVTMEVADDAVEAAPAAAAPVAEAAKPAPKAAPKPHKEAPTKAAATAAAKTPIAADAHVSMAGEGDPAIQALLQAATSRGGNASILKREGSMPAGAENWQRKDPRDLPPDARQAKILDAAKKAKDDLATSRRGFMGNAALFSGWFAFAAGTGTAAGPAFTRFLMPNVLEEPDPRVRVGKVQLYQEMKPGEVNEDYKNQGIWMIREEGRIAALNIICTHLGCIPTWLPNDRKFKCPCHGSGYRPNGINFEGPTPRPLERFRLSVVDGIVVVDKSKKFQYELGQWDQPGSFLEA